jgi:2-C-methyl-D-erythritol 4-phosphate cytidylyltransferase
MNIAVIFAGGVGRRMNTKDIPKQFLKLYDKPIIIHTLERFEQHPMIDAIVVVCVAEWIDYLNQLTFKYRIDKVKKVVPGGSTGQLSIYNGLVAANELTQGENAIVLIHDGVRPLINEQLITDNIECVQKHGSAITTAPEKGRGR